MKNLLFLICSTLLVLSCNKEEIKTPATISSPSDYEYKYETKVRVYSSDKPDNFVDVYAYCDDQAKLNKMEDELSTLNFSWTKSDLSEERERESKALFDYQDSIPVHIHLEFPLGKENKQTTTSTKELYQFSFSKIEKATSLVHITSVTGAGLSSNTPWCYTYVKNETSWFNLGCLCTMTSANWYFSANENGSSPFRSVSLSNTDFTHVTTITPCQFNPSVGSIVYQPNATYSACNPLVPQNDKANHVKQIPASERINNTKNIQGYAGHGPGSPNKAQGYISIYRWQ